MMVFHLLDEDNSLFMYCSLFVKGEGGKGNG
jgi:hypothetical protein